MGNNYIFSLTPTFTQGLIFGQLSIIFLLIVILKYLFLEPTPAYSESDLSTPALLKERPFSRKRFAVGEAELHVEQEGEEESAVWFNLLLRQVRMTTYNRAGPQLSHVSRIGCRNIPIKATR